MGSDNFMKYSYKEYAEVYEVIKTYNDFKEKLPKEILEHIRNNAKRSRYVQMFDKKEDILKQISRNALLLIVYLHLKYIEEDEEIKGKIKEILLENEIKKR